MLETTTAAPLCDLRDELARDLDGAFERMVIAYQDRLYNFALRMTNSPEDAEEIAQDAFVRAYRAMQGYSAERIREMSLLAWLYQIALNTTRNKVRGKKLDLTPLEQHSENTGWEPADETRRQPDALAVRRESSRELGQQVALLPPRYRAAVVLRCIGELSYDEVAAVLDQPVGTVKSNVHLGLELLRQALSAQETGLAQVGR